MTIKAVPIPLASGKTGWVHAGPTRELPHGYRLIRCAEEIPVERSRVAFDVATRDFSPFDEAKLASEVPRILKALEHGERLYVGCMGGTGRTGTLLALLVAQHPAFTGRMAVAYVRQEYKAGAVETKEQEAQVDALTGSLTGARAPVHPDFEWSAPEEPANVSSQPGLFSRLRRLFAAG